MRIGCRQRNELIAFAFRRIRRDHVLRHLDGEISPTPLAFIGIVIATLLDRGCHVGRVVMACA
jgi:hypothetical protein